MDRSLFDAARRRPALLLAAATALFVALMAVQAQADTHAPSTVTLCANPAGQLTIAPESGCPANTTAYQVATGDGLDAATAELEAADAALEGRVNDLEASNTTLTGKVAVLETTVEDLGTTVDELVESNTQLTNRLGAAEVRIDDLESTFDGVSRDGATLLFTGMNLQVVNGTGSTDGDPNGFGSVIIGYNTERPTTDEWGESDKTGSHYLVVGNENNYTEFGGIVAGFRNTAGGEYSSVTGGAGSTASGQYSSVTGGAENRAVGQAASVSGGTVNSAIGIASSVSGGESNRAMELTTSVSGGSGNTANQLSASILGGKNQTADSQQFEIYPSAP